MLKTRPPGGALFCPGDFVLGGRFPSKIPGNGLFAFEDIAMREQNVRLHTKDGAWKKVSVVTLRGLKQRGEKAVCVTAYDYPAAVFADRAGVDVILVGDSAAMTVLGLPNTLGVGMNEMLIFAKAVARGAQRALVIGDLPFLSYQVSNEEAIRNADAGIAVMGRLGLTPQSFGQQGGYRVQGKTRAAAERIAADASGWHTDADPLADIAVPVGAPTRPLLHTT